MQQHTKRCRKKFWTEVSLLWSIGLPFSHKAGIAIPQEFPEKQVQAMPLWRKADGFPPKPYNDFTDGFG